MSFNFRYTSSVRQGDLFGDQEALDVLVAGAGPAGLFAALAAAEAGAKVLSLEKMTSPGIKLLASGAGRCNITHEGPIADFLEHYGPRQGRFLKHALFSFDNAALEAWFSRRGLPLLSDGNGKLFPETGRARDVLDTILAEAAGAGVEIRRCARVLSARREKDLFRIETSAGSFASRTLVVATGGASYPGTGSSGEGYGLAAAFGHAIVEPRPCLAPIEISGGLPAACAGISIPGARFAVRRGKALVLRTVSDILFTHRGLSGPAVLDASRSIEAGDTVLVSLLPGRDRAEVERELLAEIAVHGRRGLGSCLQALGLPERLAEALLGWAGLGKATVAANLDRLRRARLVDAIDALPLLVERVGGFDEAMATRGGVSLSELEPRSLASRLVPGLHFAGEVIDVDGDSGGYNLQAAFSTGRLAGLSAAGEALRRG